MPGMKVCSMRTFQLQGRIGFVPEGHLDNSPRFQPWGGWTQRRESLRDGRPGTIYAPLGQNHPQLNGSASGYSWRWAGVLVLATKLSERQAPKYRPSSVSCCGVRCAFLRILPIQDSHWT